MLTIMIERVKIDGLIDGIVPNLVDEGLSILQYHDTIIFMEHDFDEEKNSNLQCPTPCWCFGVGVGLVVLLGDKSRLRAMDACLSIFIGLC
jgi:hypothetical protein